MPQLSACRFKFDDPFMNEMMNIQKDLEKSFDSPSNFFYVLPLMKNFPSKVMVIVIMKTTAPQK